MSTLKRKNKWWVDFGFKGKRIRIVSPKIPRLERGHLNQFLGKGLSRGEDLVPKEKKKCFTLNEFSEKMD